MGHLAGGQVDALLSEIYDDIGKLEETLESPERVGRKILSGIMGY